MLRCRGMSCSLVQLLPRLQSLLSLDIVMAYGTAYGNCLSQSILSTIAQCHNLRNLKLCFEDSYSFSFPSGELLRLAEGCRRLERLIVEACEDALHFDDMVDAEFGRVAKFLPNLRKLNLRPTIGISATGLISLGTHCPDMEECRLSAHCDLSLLRTREETVFPRLRKLDLAGHTCDGEAPAELVAAIMWHHLPCLQKFRSNSDTARGRTLEPTVWHSFKGFRQEPHRKLLQGAISKIEQIEALSKQR